MKIYIINNDGDYSSINTKCYDKAYEIYGKNIPEKIKERLDLELNSIKKNKFEFIYLLASDAVKKSHELGYKTGNRGCIGNSFVAFLLEITDINPIDYNVPFEILAGINYDKQPDIELNFSDKVIDKIIKYILN